MQSRKSSLLESLLGTSFAFCISVGVWEFIVKPLWGINTSFIENISITSLFTVVSFVRSYFWRRLWQWLDHGRGWTTLVARLKNKNKKAANETHRNHREGARG